MNQDKSQKNNTLATLAKRSKELLKKSGVSARKQGQELVDALNRSQK